MKKILVYFRNNSSSKDYLANTTEARSDLFDGLVISTPCIFESNFVHADIIFDTSKSYSRRIIRDYVNRLADDVELPIHLFFRINARTRRDRKATSDDLKVIADRMSDFFDLLQHLDRFYNVLFDPETYGATFPTPADDANMWKHIGEQDAFDFGYDCFRRCKAEDVILTLGFLYCQRPQSLPRYQMLPAFLRGALTNRQINFHDYIQQGYAAKTRSSHAYYRTHPTLGYENNVGKYRNYFHSRSLFPQADWTADDLYNSIDGALAETDKFVVLYDQYVLPGVNVTNTQISKIASAYSKQRLINARGF